MAGRQRLAEAARGPADKAQGQLPLLRVKTLTMAGLVLALVALLLELGPATVLAGPDASSQCQAALVSACSGARRASVGNCYVCSGANNRALERAQCTDRSIQAWCSGDAAPAGGAGDGQLVLEKVILLSRHGIRTPYPAGYIGFDNYSVLSADGRVWPSVVPPLDPAWGANGNAFLTAHGSAVLTAHGRYYRDETWSDLGGQSCSDLTVYADPDPNTHRDLNTARAFMSGMLPGCPGLVDPAGAAIQHGPEVSAIFNQGNPKSFLHGVTPAGCPGMPAEGLLGGAFGGSISNLADNAADELEQLGKAIGCAPCRPEICHAAAAASVGGGGDSNASTPCTLARVGPARFNGEHFWSVYNGSLAVASNVAEFVQMMYLNNMSMATVLCPKGNQDCLDATAKIDYEVGRLTRLHQLNLRVTDGNPFVARAFGSDLLAHITATMQQLLFGTPVPGLKSKPTDKLVYYAGHDINVR
jgi:hypothetical protein